MRVLVDEEADGEVVRPLRVDHVRLALRRFGFADVGEGHRIGREGRGEHPEREPREVLLHRGDARRARIHRRPRRGAGRGGGGRGRRRRRRILQPLVAVEARRRRTALLRRDFILAQVLVGQLDEDLEFDRDEILAAHLARASGRREGLDGGQLLFAAERLPRRGEHRRRVLGLGRDGPGHGNDRGEHSHRSTLCENAHLSASQPRRSVRVRITCP